MAIKSKADLKVWLDANINTNGVNAITGAIMNTFLTDVVDSFVNSITDSLKIVTNVYRSGTKAITTAVTTVTFSSPMPAATYDVIIEDPNGVGWKDITDKTVNSFKITGLSSGVITYFVIL